MVNTTVLKELIVSFWDQPIGELKPRKIQIPDLKIKKAISLVWPRRSWKTSLCFLKIKELLSQWVDKKNILYVNFEDERLIDFSLEDFDKLLKLYFELSGVSTKQKWIRFFFDEIQNVNWWEKFIARILTSFDIKVVITGSSAKMLSSQINTALRWKSLSLEVMPLSFEEFLGFKQITLPENFEYSIDGQNQYLATVKEFITWWGFPEVVLEENQMIKRWILKTYYDLIFYKDIVDRFGVRDVVGLKKFRSFLTWNFANLVSLKKFAKDFWISYPVVLSWYEYFQDSYFGFALKRFSFSLKSVEKSLSKFYLVDGWFFYANFGQINAFNLSRLFENAVFGELRKLGLVPNEQIFYYKSKDFDIDFVVFDQGEVIPIQVSYELGEENFERE